MQYIKVVNKKFGEKRSKVPCENQRPSPRAYYIHENVYSVKKQHEYTDTDLFRISDYVIDINKNKLLKFRPLPKVPTVEDALFGTQTRIRREEDYDAIRKRTT